MSGAHPSRNAAASVEWLNAGGDCVRTT